MLRKWFLVVLAIVGLAVGCATTGSRYETEHATSVDLKDAHYRVVKSGAVGTSHGFKLLGFIPLVSPSYVSAMNDLRSQAPMEGRATAVANVVQEESSIWLLLFSIPKVTISADIIEFTEDLRGR